MLLPSKWVVASPFEVYSRSQDRCAHLWCHIADVITSLTWGATFYFDISSDCMNDLHAYFSCNLKHAFPGWRTCDVLEQTMGLAEVLERFIWFIVGFLAILESHEKKKGRKQLVDQINCSYDIGCPLVL